MCYDAYNGTFLWERNIPGAVRVRADVDGGNLCLAKDALYVAAMNKCFSLDPVTGNTVKTYDLPEVKDPDAITSRTVSSPETRTPQKCSV